MKMNSKTEVIMWEKVSVIALTLAITFFGTIVGAETEKAATEELEAPKVEEQTEQAQAIQPEVEVKAGDEVADKRKEIIKEATGAIAQVSGSCV